MQKNFLKFKKYFLNVTIGVTFRKYNVLAAVEDWDANRKNSYILTRKINLKEEI